MNKLLAIVGPTAVGKTAMSIKLAQKFDGEIISGDSMQVYRGLDIGTAKVTDEEKAGIPHYLINVRDIHERFSVADFVHEATTLITDISDRHKLPIVVGGTGFYLQALLEGLTLGGDTYRDSELRKKLKAEAENQGPQKLHDRLAKVDPVSAARIPVNNVRRVVRALEVYIKTGQPISQQTNQQVDLDDFVVGLNTDRAILYQRINQRVDAMMAAGLLTEAKMLFENGGTELQAGKGIGYHEFDPYFEGRISLDQAVEQVKQDSRHYAKRQLTWFRNKTKPHWYDVITSPYDVNRLMKDVERWWQQRN